MSRTLRAIAYNVEPEEQGKPDGYEAILEQTRKYISSEHADELAAVISDNSSCEAVRGIISAFVDDHRLHLPGLDMRQLADRLYGDMAGFGFLDKYIYDQGIEEINGNAGTISNW